MSGSWARSYGTSFGGIRSFLSPFANRVADLFTSEGFTGWGTFPVEFRRRDGGEAPLDYVGLSVTGTCGPLEEGIGRYRFDPDGWDGSDFFGPPGTTVIFVTERVVRALRACNVRNIYLECLADAECPFVAGM